MDMMLALALLAQDYDGLLYDAHLHGSGDRSVKELVELQKKAGIERTMVFLGPRGEPLEGVPHCTTLLIDPATKKQLVTQASVDWLEKALAGGKVRGIGELAFRHRKAETEIDAGGEIPRKIYDLAAKHKVPVTVHVESTWAGELEKGLAHNRDAAIVWAHAGDAAPKLVRELLKKHANLHADLSCRNPLFKRGFPKSEQSMTDDGGKLQPEWRKLLEEYPDRFLFGSDVGGQNADRIPLLPEIAKYYRGVLGQISREAAEKIGHGNAERLFGK
jgi:predicted TIM-barrel fold metal-dependent hydrolase